MLGKHRYVSRSVQTGEYGLVVIRLCSHSLTSCRLAYIDTGLTLLYIEVGLRLYIEAGLRLYIEAGLRLYIEAGLRLYIEAGLRLYIEAGLRLYIEAGQ